VDNVSYLALITFVVLDAIGVPAKRNAPNVTQHVEKIDVMILVVNI